MTCPSHRWFAQTSSAGRFGAGNAYPSNGGKPKQWELCQHDVSAIPPYVCRCVRSACPVDRMGDR